MVSFDFVDEGIHVVAEFKNGVSVLYGMSGSGKTYLLSSLYRESLRRGIKAVYKNYIIADNPDSLIESATKCDFMLLDNADLYMSMKLYNRLNAMGIPIVMSLHNLLKVNSRYCPVYKVHFDSSDIYLESLFNG